ncbi:uroporphyrinogen-III synthase [Agrobacterium larrymoorei]|uniref:Uroporphyrinogen-III synthase n=1 Tax=Agrobacterium larrymoorei TaxID=160699 RepID=A0ABU0UQJ9_9HYPH|nr:uroporphyrinogen-III synthase [Agrobacterium larrymoorei]MDQ1187250.1 uroporphyrinogen-III synthase [Agrobacterium larrymoorei]
MRVVVTRPMRSGQKTETLLQERGHEPILLPLTEAMHKAEAARELLAREPDALAVTSAEAFRALKASGIDLSSHIDRPLFAVGAATAEAARESGFKTIMIGDGDGTALAHLVKTTLVPIAQASAANSRHLLYLAGRPREGGFETALTNSAIRLDVAEIYEMQPVLWERPALRAALDPKPGAVLLYSRETARIFFDLVDTHDLAPALSACRFICISEKVLDVVPTPHRSRAVASATPSEHAMLQLLDGGTGT